MNSCFSIYDQGISKKLEKVIPGRVLVSPVEIALIERHKQMASQSRKSVKSGVEMPFISFWRVDHKLGLESGYNEALFRRGFNVGLKKTSEGNLVRRLKTLPIELAYQFDIWATSEVVLDEFYREFVFSILSNPSIDVEVDKGSLFRYSLRMDSEENNSDIASFVDKQKVYRKTIMMSIPQAKIHLAKDEIVPNSIILNIKGLSRVIDGEMGIGGKNESD